MAKVLKHLITGEERWASNLMKIYAKSENIREPSLEESLEVKTRLGLTKRMYIGVQMFSKNKQGARLFQPWKKIMLYRDSILPKINPPVWENGVLSISCTLRDMMMSIASRIIQLNHVKDNISSLAVDGEDINFECTFHVSAGLDSATAFPHYNQANILQKDDSLLTENLLPLMLVTKNGVKLWVNPNPQSDTFCRAKSMTWTKETAEVTKTMFLGFYEEVESINAYPIEVSSNGIHLRITLEAIFAMVDGKAANAIVGNRDTHACPQCVKGADPRVGPGFFHCRLNTVEWLIRVSAQKQVENHPSQSNSVVLKEQRKICDDLERAFKVSVNRPKIGGSGSSNTGNMARRLLADPAKFAKCLHISLELVEKIRLLSCLALSSHELDNQKVETLYVETEALIFREFPFIKRLPPSVHKYSHLSKFIAELVSIEYTQKIIIIL